MKKAFAFYDRVWEHLAAKWLRVLFCGLGVEGGQDARSVGMIPVIVNEGTMQLGSGIVFRSQIARVVVATNANAHLALGERVFINSGTIIRAHKDIEIGDDCRIGELCAIYDTDSHAIGQHDAVRVESVKLGRNVWLGRGVTILPGVTIGDHSVIGAGSVVTKSIPAKSLAVGNPAKVVREIDCSDDFIRA